MEAKALIKSILKCKLDIHEGKIRIKQLRNQIKEEKIKRDELRKHLDEEKIKIDKLKKYLDVLLKEK